MPTVNVRFYASLRETIGQREITLTLPDGATVEHVRARVGETYPLVKPFLPNVVCAVGEEYVPVTHTLREGDLVALIPPVSGGC
jgi:molybdopterin synthase sulfur carrier subunit